MNTPTRVCNHHASRLIFSVSEKMNLVSVRPSNPHSTSLSALASAGLLIASLSFSACDKSVDTPEPPQATAPSAPANPQRDAMARVLDNAAKAQAAGLGKGELIVNGAWNYTGYSTLSPLPEARLVAVDVTVTGHTPTFDFDDIEIVDPQRKVSYGSDPFLALLTPEGKFQADMSRMPIAPATTRLLLVYGFPKDQTRFNLVYWHKKLNREPVTIAEHGWEVPFPEKASTAPAE